MMIALEMRLLDPVVEKKGQPITATELAATTNSDKTLTGMEVKLNRASRD